MVRNGSDVKQAIESTPTGATVSLYHDTKLTSVCRLHIVYCLNVYQLLWTPETRGKYPFNFGFNSSQTGGMAAILVFHNVLHTDHYAIRCEQHTDTPPSECQ